MPHSAPKTFYVMRHWFVVQRKTKRLTTVVGHLSTFCSRKPGRCSPPPQLSPRPNAVVGKAGALFMFESGAVV